MLFLSFVCDLRLWSRYHITSITTNRMWTNEIIYNSLIYGDWAQNKKKTRAKEQQYIHTQQSFGFTVKLKLKLEANFPEIGLVGLITDDTLFLKISGPSAKTQRKHNFHVESNWTFHSLTVLEGMKLLFRYMYICVCVYIVYVHIYLYFIYLYVYMYPCLEHSPTSQSTTTT